MIDMAKIKVLPLSKSSEIIQQANSNPKFATFLYESIVMFLLDRITLVDLR